MRPLSWSGIEVVITALTRNQVYGNVPWVRIPPAPHKAKASFTGAFVLYIADSNKAAVNEAPVEPQSRARPLPAGKVESHPLRQNQAPIRALFQIPAELGGIPPQPQSARLHTVETACFG